MTQGGLNASFGNYWGVVRSAAGQALSTAALWVAINAWESAQNILRPPGLFQWVTQARSLAVQQRLAATQFQAAGEAAALDASMIAQDYNARPLDQQTLAPIYRVRFEVNIITDTGPATQWLTFTPANGVLPATKGELVDQLNQASVGASSSYEGVITGLTGDMGITAG